MENENICCECDAAGLTVSLNIFGYCDECLMFGPDGDPLGARVEIQDGKHIVIKKEEKPKHGGPTMQMLSDMYDDWQRGL